jgi:hypothetical protein
MTFAATIRIERLRPERDFGVQGYHAHRKRDNFSLCKQYVLFANTYSE